MKRKTIVHVHVKRNAQVPKEINPDTCCNAVLSIRFVAATTKVRGGELFPLALEVEAIVARTSKDAQGEGDGLAALSSANEAAGNSTAEGKTAAEGQIAAAATSVRKPIGHHDRVEERNKNSQPQPPRPGDHDGDGRSSIHNTSSSSSAGGKSKRSWYRHRQPPQVQRQKEDQQQEQQLRLQQEQQLPQSQEKRVVFLSAWGAEERQEWAEALSRRVMVLAWGWAWFCFLP